MSCQTVAIPSYIPVIQMARTCCLMVVVVALQKKPQVHFGINLLTAGNVGQDLALTTHLKGLEGELSSFSFDKEQRIQGHLHLKPFDFVKGLPPIRSRR